MTAPSVFPAQPVEQAPFPPVPAAPTPWYRKRGWLALVIAVVLIAAGVAYFATRGGDGGSIATLQTTEGPVVVKAVQTGTSVPVGSGCTNELPLSLVFDNNPELNVYLDFSTGDVCRFAATSGYQVALVTLDQGGIAHTFSDAELTSSGGRTYDNPYTFDISGLNYLAFTTDAEASGLMLQLPGAAPLAI